MQGINRGHLALTGLIGGLIGILFVALSGAPAEFSVASPQSARAVDPSVSQADSTNIDTSADSRKLRDMLWKHQRIEAESYPGLAASLSAATAGPAVSAGAASSDQAPGPRTLRDALWEHQRVEEEYYPGR